MEDLLIDNCDRKWDMLRTSHKQWELRRQSTPVWIGRWHGFHDHGLTLVKEVAGLIEGNLPEGVLSWNCEEDGVFVFEYAEINVRISTSSERQSFLSPEIVDTAGAIPRRSLDPIRSGIRKFFKTAPPPACFRTFAVLVLQVLEQVTVSMREWHDRAFVRATGRGWNAYEVASWDSIKNDDTGLNLNSIKDTAFHILGMTVPQICENIPEAWRILHVESILREDLTERFLNRKKRLRRKLEVKATYASLLKGKNPLSRTKLRGREQSEARRTRR